MTTTAQPTFRKTRDGQWVAFGPATQLHTGSLAVAKRNGSTKIVQIEKIGRIFDVDGVECAYGYIADDENDRWMVERMPAATATRRRGWVVKVGRTWECGACGETEMLDWDRRCCNECGNHA